MLCDRVALEIIHTSQKKTEGILISEHWVLTLNQEGAQQPLKSTTRLRSSEKRMQDVARRTHGKDSTRLLNHSSQSTNKTAKRTSV